MNTTEMLAQLRLNCLLEDGAVDYTDAVLLRELNDSLTTKFQDMIVGFRNGTWQDSYAQALTSGQPMYRLPTYVTVVGKIEIGYGSSATRAQIDAINWIRLPKVDEGHADLFEGSYSGLGVPKAYTIRGNNLVFFPTPDNAGYVIRVTYYRKPSDLYASQNLVSGTDRGRILSVNVAARQITVNAMPFDMSLAVPAAITNNNTPWDIVRYGGWFDPVLSSVTSFSVGGNTVTFAEPITVRDVQVGDYLRANGQTDWPMLPDDFHRALVDVCSAKILVQRGYQQKASNFAGDVTADMGRFENLYGNRVREEPRVIRAPLTQLRRWRMR